MARFAQIDETSTVINIIEAESADALPGVTLIAIEPGQDVGPGYTWDGANFTPPPAPPGGTSPGPDYAFKEEEQRWYKVVFTKKDFMLFVGVEKIAALNGVIASGNPLAKTVHDLLMAAEYIDVQDPSTRQMLTILTTDSGGLVLTAEDVARILKGLAYER